MNQFTQLARIGRMAGGAGKQRALEVTVGAHLDRHELGIRSQRIATEMAARNLKGDDFRQAFIAHRKAREIGERARQIRQLEGKMAANKLLSAAPANLATEDRRFSCFA